jgi:hypothetical protein
MEAFCHGEWKLAELLDGCRDATSVTSKIAHGIGYVSGLDGKTSQT